MTRSDSLSRDDLKQLAELEIDPAEIERQLRIFRQPPAPARLIRPCRSGDGITQLSDSRREHYEDRWRDFSGSQRLAKFVPASGAATRMFRELAMLADDGGRNESDAAARRSVTERFVTGLPRFAFNHELASRLRSHGLELDRLVEEGDLRPVVQFVLDEVGLGYRNLPKGLVLFHDYPEGPRTAVEEQLLEGAGYLAQPGGTGRVHFTVAAGFLESFRETVERILSEVERQTEIALDVEFSTQSPATDTIAVDLDNCPVRRSDGRLLLRPAGHGALLGNLERVDADVVFIKNIDNVAHRRQHSTSIQWKRALAGYFTELRHEAYELLSLLDTGTPDPAVVSTGLRFIRERLTVEPPTEILDAGVERQSAYLVARLDRPLRVCGMVRNVGEPGGGPFWLADDEGGLSGQIVERAQVDFRNADQASVWEASTHFNPTDLICGLRDRHGRPYPLNDFLDPAAAFVTEKTHLGQPLKALERPGLWNGSMARWNTAFVEVPLATFTPVKTIFDLLRPEHQP